MSHTLLFRSTRVLRLPRGRYSSMLDLGGVSPSDTKKDSKINVGQNNKLQAVALDFNLITRAIDHQREEMGKEVGEIKKGGGIHTTNGTGKNNESILPDTNFVQDMAALLNVKLGGEEDKSYNDDDKSDDFGDDLSLLTGSSSSDNNTATKKVSNFDPAALDIRARYAAKLRKKVEGGLAGVELANSRKEEALTKGDAAGHLAARAIAASTTVSKSGSKWMASTGTGTLCSFLSNRSMKIALIPIPGEEDRQKTNDHMDLLARQLPTIKFSVLGINKDLNINEASDILKHITSELNTKPISTLVVSDRDDYLRSARDLGIFTCRVRKKNMPRGNVTTNYTVEDVKEVEAVVNDLNGISYNTVFNQ